MPTTWMGVAAVAAGILAATTAGLVAAELAARWWIRRRAAYFVMPPGLRLQVRVDPAVCPQMESVVRFEVNRDGERGDEVPWRTRGLYRVMVGGGSQSEGFLLDQDTAWPGALQRILERPEHARALGAARVHVGCVSRSGVGSEALEMILERVLPRYPRLQLIIISVGATDVLRWLEHGGTRPLPPVRTAEVFRCHPEGPFSWSPSQLAVNELLRRTRRQWLHPVKVYPHGGRWYTEARAMRARASNILTTNPDPTPMLDEFERNYNSIVRKAQAHADRVLLVTQPWFDADYSPAESAQMWHGGVGQPWREPVTTFFSFNVVSDLMRLLNDRTEAVAERFGLERIDLMSVLPASLDTYYDCFHFGPEGSRMVARAVAATVLRDPGLRLPGVAPGGSRSCAALQES